ncbi:protein kinase domain-containing protein [Dyella agri]|uniref:Protein kinase n=1 Tax=Dyella agri TaxID=1926869 RepID=A0ABW8KKH5_9GAMM
MDRAQADALRDSLVGRTVGGWSIDGFHGHGKSAVVMASQRNGVRGAIKVFHPELIERFGREVQLERIRRETSLVGIRHENLVEILGGGVCEDTGHLFVVMEELDWRNLKDALLDVPDESIKIIIRDVALAARFLENRALVHRDIKPENIAVNADYTRAKLLDLGVIRPFGLADLTDVNARPFIGTLRYSSPEFLRREEEDTPDGWRAISFHQIGAVLHDLLMKVELFHEYSEPYPVLVEAVQKVLPQVHGMDAELTATCKHSLVKSPKTRLELVTWSSFIPGEDGAPKALALHEKIKLRQRYHQEVNMESGLADGEGWRLLKQTLEEVSSALDIKIAVLLSTLKCFPLHTIQHRVSAETSSFSSIVSFESDKSIGLPTGIDIVLDMSLIDHNNGDPVYRLSGQSSTVGVSGEKLMLVVDEVIVLGLLNDVIASPRIEEFLLSTLEKAYEALDLG